MAIEYIRSRINLEANDESETAVATAGARLTKWESGKWLGLYTFTANKDGWVHQVDLGVRFTYRNEEISVNAYDLYHLVYTLRGGKLPVEYYNRNIAKTTKAKIWTIESMSELQLETATEKATQKEYLESNYVDLAEAYEMCRSIEERLSENTANEVRTFLEQQAARRSEEFEF